MQMEKSSPIKHIWQMGMFSDRSEAGRTLAEHLKPYAKRDDVIVLALLRGGMPVAYEVAQRLDAELDISVVKKLGVPGQEELAMGAIATQGVAVFNDYIIESLRISKATIDQVLQMERQELQRRELSYRGDRPLPKFSKKTVILIDDGIATGATMRAAIKSLQRQKPAQIIVAIPVAGKDICDEIGRLVDKVVCPFQPSIFYGVGAWYKDFPPISDTEVCDLYAKGCRRSL